MSDYDPSSAIACRRLSCCPNSSALEYPDRLNAAAELLKGGAPADLAVVNAHGRWTYADLDDFSGRIARLLVEEEGLVPGNRVLLRGPNGYTLFACWLGVLKAGGIVVATMPLLRPGEIATVIERAQISHALIDSRFIGDFREAADQTHAISSSSNMMATSARARWKPAWPSSNLCHPSTPAATIRR